jgi:hypothetical protein
MTCNQVCTLSLLQFANSPLSAVFASARECARGCLSWPLRASVCCGSTQTKQYRERVQFWCEQESPRRPASIRHINVGGIATTENADHIGAILNYNPGRVCKLTRDFLCCSAHCSSAAHALSILMGVEQVLQMSSACTLRCNRTCT